MLIRLLIIIFFLFNLLGFSQISKLPFPAKEDTATVRLIFKTCKDSMRNGNFLAARDFSRIGIELAQKINDKKGLVLSYQVLASSYNGESNNDSSLFYFNKALEICKVINNKKGEAMQYGNIGLVYYGQSKYKEAMTFFLKSLKISETINDSIGIARAENNIGSVYWYQKAYQNALTHYLRAEEIRRNIKDYEGQAMALNNIAMIYETMRDGKGALKYYEQAVELHKKTGNDWGLAMALNGIGAIYQDINKDFLSAEKYYKESMIINKKLHNVDGLGLNLLNLGTIRIELKDFKGAENFLFESIDWYKTNNMPQGVMRSYEKISEMYYLNHNYKDAFEYHVKYSNLHDSINLGDKLAEMEAKYGKEKHESEINLLKKEKEVQELEIKRKRIVIYSTVVGVLILVIFIIFIVRGYYAKKKANQLLEMSNIQITHQKDIIEEKNQEITDSINYAKRIQYSLLANKKMLDLNLRNYFLIFRPKDVVSGDFYWGSQMANGKFILATADSTGHGVPGAIMSMLNMSCLNESVNSDKLIQPAEILNSTRKKIIDHLSNDGSEEGGKDGMDCSLMVIDPHSKKLVYAAAHNPVWLVRDKRLITLEADRMPVGKHLKDKNSFSQHEVELKSGDMIYASTDGYQDQFGGEKGKKFKSKQLEELLVSISHESLPLQQEILINTFEKWKGELEQVDDVTLIGIKI